VRKSSVPSKEKATVPLAIGFPPISLSCTATVSVSPTSTEVDGEAIGPEGERIAIEIKTSRDDLARGIRQLAEAIAFGYDKAVLVEVPQAEPAHLKIIAH